mmetsp:Transcript_19191/g.47977  ORF Transcript_19191/g.47977 Transcript_19191/m.47977 type:complete len:197 (-) Transcript_19191:755-1345(-)
MSVPDRRIVGWCFLLFAALPRWCAVSGAGGAETVTEHLRQLFLDEGGGARPREEFLDEGGSARSREEPAASPAPHDEGSVRDQIVSPRRKLEPEAERGSGNKKLLRFSAISREHDRIPRNKQKNEEVGSGAVALVQRSWNNESNSSNNESVTEAPAEEERKREEKAISTELQIKLVLLLAVRLAQKTNYPAMPRTD